METRSLKVMFNKAGGTAGKTAYSPKISIPKAWIDKMGLSLDDRDVEVTFINNEIVIKKKK